MALLEPDQGPSMDASDGVAGNTRLTSLTAIVLLVLLFVEGLTVLIGVQQEISIHVFVGMLLLPPIALKLASTGYRFARYYTGSRAYRDAGPPFWTLRALGPIVVLATITLFGSGIYLIVIGRDQTASDIHRLSFFVWVATMTVHVLGHLREIGTAIRDEWTRRAPLRGATARLIAVAVAVGVGLGIAILTVHLAGAYSHHPFDGRFDPGH